MEKRSLRGKDGKQRPTDWRKLTARQLNAVLLVLAVGLAAVDLTCFSFIKTRDALPSAARASALPVVAATSPKRTKLSLAALAPTKPDAPLTGW